MHEQEDRDDDGDQREHEREDRDDDGERREHEQEEGGGRAVVHTPQLRRRLSLQWLAADPPPDGTVKVNVSSSMAARGSRQEQLRYSKAQAAETTPDMCKNSARQMRMWRMMLQREDDGRRMRDLCQTLVKARRYAKGTHCGRKQLQDAGAKRSTTGNDGARGGSGTM